MEVKLLAAPMIFLDAAKELGYVPGADDPLPGDILTEIAGRICYQSWHRPNPATATNAGYVDNIVQQAHFSVMEHAQYVFTVQGVSRALTHELIRHRMLQYSQRSQRYVDEAEGDFVIPIEVLRSLPESARLTMLDAHHVAVDHYKGLVEDLAAVGVPRKLARQAARYVLPNGHTTQLVVSGNLRSWREVFQKRLAVGMNKQPLADLEIFQLCQWFLLLLHRQAPNCMYDLWQRQLAWLASGPEQLLVIEPLRALLPSTD